MKSNMVRNHNGFFQNLINISEYTKFIKETDQ